MTAAPDAGSSPDPEGGRLAENVMHFARILRKGGIPVGPGRIADALEALQLGCITSRADFYCTLRACFVSRHDQQPFFDQAFDAFWRAPKMREQLLSLLLAQISRLQGPSERRAGSRRLAEALFDEQDLPQGQPAQELELDASFSASLDEILRHKDFEQMSSEEQAEAKAALARMRLLREPRPTRRFRTSSSGAELDLRRALRQQLRAGGQLIGFPRKERRMRLPPLVFLCDISGSMSGYTRMLLHFIHALANDGDRISVFLFGTRLTNITRDLQRRDVDEALDRVSKSVVDWSGGTRIGHALHEFNFRWSRRVLAQGAHVVLITDGLDREDAAYVADEMRRLKRAATRLIWLNPLLRYAGFEARASGIRAMLPHVDEFRAAHNLASLEDLAETLFKPDMGAHDPRRWLRQSPAA